MGELVVETVCLCILSYYISLSVYLFLFHPLLFVYIFYRKHEKHRSLLC